MSAQDELAVIIAVALKQVPADRLKRLNSADWLAAEQAGSAIAKDIADVVRRSFEIERRPMPVAPSRSQGTS